MCSKLISFYTEKLRIINSTQPAFRNPGAVAPGFQRVKKASQSLPRKRQIESKSFLVAACTWTKILLRLQVCELCAVSNRGNPIKRECALWGEEPAGHRWSFPLGGNGTLCLEWRRSARSRLQRFGGKARRAFSTVSNPGAVAPGCPYQVEHFDAVTLATPEFD